MSNAKQFQAIIYTIHVLVWSYLFAAPFLFSRGEEHINWIRGIPHFSTTLSSCLLFYFTYLFLVPKLVFQKKKHYRLLFLSIAIAALLLTVFFELLYNWTMPIVAENLRLRGAPYGHAPFPPNSIDIAGFRVFPVGLVRNFTTFVTSAGIAVLLQLSLRWQRSENDRQKAEAARVEAELQVLRHQLSPHFLLNSLNNIYSLVAFDTTKAQNAIVELSKMLRYQLYESDVEFIPLKKEKEFLGNYISLMRIRLPESNMVETQCDCDDENLLVAPNILIYLVENAFKYGAQPSGKALISIRLTVRERQLNFCCMNTINHQRVRVSGKSDEPKNNGLGLQQVERMLQIYYRDRYTWTYGPTTDNLYYRSTLQISL